MDESDSDDDATSDDTPDVDEVQSTDAAMTSMIPFSSAGSVPTSASDSFFSGLPSFGNSNAVTPLNPFPFGPSSLSVGLGQPYGAIGDCFPYLGGLNGDLIGSASRSPMTSTNR